MGNESSNGSYEKVLRNRLRFSWEISLGDVALLVSALVCIIRLFDSVADHEKRITKLEVSQSAQEARINNSDKNIAILNNAIWPDSERIKNSQ